MSQAVRALFRYALPLAIIVALSAYLFVRRDDRLHYELPVLPPMAEGAVDRIDVERGDARVVLRRTDGGWMIEGPGYLAEPGIVDGMVRAAATLTLSDLIAKEPTYGRYGLGDTEAITTTFRAGTELVRVLRIGKRAPTYSHTYVLIDDDPRVYQATGDLTRAFSTQEQVLRDKSILSFETTDISVISIRTAAGTLELRRGVPPTQEESVTWSASSGGDRDPQTIRQALDRLAGMVTSRFIETVPETALLVELEFRGPETTHRLTIYPKADGAHVATSSDADGPFVLLPVLLTDVFAAFEVESE